MKIQTRQNLKYFLYARKSSENEDKQVASIPSQLDALNRIAKEHKIKIAEHFIEEKSARKPGRPIFNEMLQRIQKKEARGIICWKLDRLARNPVDGGNINWMLQQGIIQNIQTHERSYFPSDNVIMMMVEFGMANQFSIDLGANTKRGYMNKIKEGWFPHKPPIGYLSNKYKRPEHSPIYKDPERFDLMKQFWRILLDKRLSMKEMKKVADKIGLRTERGKPLAVSKVHYLLTNPFYYGHFKWDGIIYSGKHQAMISKREFDMAQAIINGKLKSRMKYRSFAYTGMIRCGECNAAITAEHKTKHQKNGNTHNYTYYRCTKKIDDNCSQKSIRQDRLETQIEQTLSQVSIPESFHKWAIKYLKEEQAIEIEDRNKIRFNQKKAQENCSWKLDQLLELRLNGEIDPEEYKNRKEVLIEEKRKLEDIMADTNKREETWLSRAEDVLTFAETARERFRTGDMDTKRQILSYLGSNLLFENGFLRIKLQTPLEKVGNIAPEVRSLHARLEPNKMSMNQSDWDVLYAKNQRWGD